MGLSRRWRFLLWMECRIAVVDLEAHARLRDVWAAFPGNDGEINEKGGGQLGRGRRLVEGCSVDEEMKSSEVRFRYLCYFDSAREFVLVTATRREDDHDWITTSRFKVARCGRRRLKCQRRDP